MKDVNSVSDPPSLGHVNVTRAKGRFELETDCMNVVRDMLNANEWDAVYVDLNDRGHPAFYLVTPEGTFMLTVQTVSHAVMGVKDEASSSH